MSEELIILTDDEFEPETGSKGWGEPIRQVAGRLREVKVDPAELEGKMTAFVRSIGQVFQQANAELPADSELRLEEVELAVKIGAKGQVKLIAGGEVSSEGCITLKFKRSQK
ncbi:hypothetical protein ACN4EG_27525 [Alkalinema pantanalense CENA528]|uniref:Pepco domain-containing protein n=1 Tax=Alkalinema pantanalense TaxID=1620705 RepID=UPI003D6FB4F5